MAATSRPVLELGLLGLQSYRADPAADSGLSTPTWCWPEGQQTSVDHTDARPLTRLLAGRFVERTGLPGSPGKPGPDSDCRGDDPDRLALEALGLGHSAASSDADSDQGLQEIDALTRALGDWRLDGLDGGERDGFTEQLSAWRREGFDRLVCFDPVHLKAETDHAITFGPRFLGLDDEEIEHLLTEMNAWLGHDDMRALRIGRQVYLLARTSTDGVGPGSAGQRRAGAPLACLLNRNAGVFLDEHHSEPALRQWLTELQMWLYPQPINDARAATGKPIVNSFWPHGMCELQADPPRPTASTALIVSDSPAVLARFEAVAWHPDTIQPVVEALEAGRSVRMLLTETAWCRLEGDLAGFQEQLHQVDDWLAVLLARQPRLAVSVDDGQGGRWQSESGLARAWRRLLSRWAR